MRCAASFFDGAPTGSFASHETVDADRGRIGTRRALVSHDVGRITSDRRFPGEWAFDDLAMIGMIEAEVERDGRTSISRRYYLCSAPPLTSRICCRRAGPLGDREPPPTPVMDVVYHDD